MGTITPSKLNIPSHAHSAQHVPRCRGKCTTPPDPNRNWSAQQPSEAPLLQVHRLRKHCLGLVRPPLVQKQETQAPECGPKTWKHLERISVGCEHRGETFDPRRADHNTPIVNLPRDFQTKLPPNSLFSPPSPPTLPFSASPILSVSVITSAIPTRACGNAGES